ncbi:MAG: hypothetical protein J6X77_05130 [Bacteroidales bacterium]|nr:hypothetical protein [Bacteroidales bacterium]
MKRFVTIALLLAGAYAMAQNPTTTWPYLYDNFKPGVIYLQGGAKSEVMMNVHLRHDQLHFIDNDLVKQADLSNTLIVSIGADSFIPSGGELRKIVAQDDNGVVAVSLIGDFAASQETGGAYGASSESASTRKLSSYDANGQVNRNHMLLLQEKENGADLNIITTYYLIRSGDCVKATRKDVSASLSEEGQAAFKAWLKQNKIKWKDPQSLLKVVGFLSENK